jgi:predicted GNAT family acetyltransferase
MRVRELSDVQALWQAAEAYLSRDPANNTHQLSAAKRILDLGARYGERFFAVFADDDETELVASAIYVDSKALFLAMMPPEAASALALHLRCNDVRLVGVIGQRDILAAFTPAFGQRFTTHVNLMLYQLMKAPDYGHATGTARVTTMDDLQLLIDWHRAFEVEVGMVAVPTPIEERVALRIKNQQLLLWVDDGKPVSMAGANPLPAASARIGPVYTPPHLRGRGYAQAVTAAASEQVQRDSPRTVFLFTDANYPASNKAYQRIGFVHVADHAHLLFDTQQQPVADREPRL